MRSTQLMAPHACDRYTNTASRAAQLFGVKILGKPAPEPPANGTSEELVRKTRYTGSEELVVEDVDLDGDPGDSVKTRSVEVRGVRKSSNKTLLKIEKARVERKEQEISNMRMEEEKKRAEKEQVKRIQQEKEAKEAERQAALQRQLSQKRRAPSFRAKK